MIEHIDDVLLSFTSASEHDNIAGEVNHGQSLPVLGCLVDSINYHIGMLSVTVGKPVANGTARRSQCNQRPG